MRIDRFIATPNASPAGRWRHPIWALGFRPFFLLAALLAALWLPLWLHVFFSNGRMALGIEPVAWHAHEMAFGFAGAVLAGFLLTAVRNWTQRSTPTGGGLAALALLWLLGRLAMLFGGVLPSALVGAIDIAFLPAVALAVGVPIVRSRNRRNYAVPLLLLALTGVNVAFHAGGNGLSRNALIVAVEILAVFLVFVGGRVIPFFTRNALPGVRVTSWAWLDWTALGTTLAVPVAQLLGQGLATDVLALAAAAANLARLIGWNPIATRGKPILWVLHVGYAWLVVGFAMLGLGRWIPAIGGSAPLHALTVGALGTLILGMMARVGLGHTGRPLVVARAVTVAFVMLTAAALVRVVGPLVLPELTTVALITSGTLWALAFLVYGVVYWPILSRPRVDGAPG